MATPKSKKRTTGEQPIPSLDDKRWQPLTMAHHTRSEELIGARFSPLASRHLMEGLKSGKLRCMRESRTNPSEREPVSSSFWQTLNIHVEPDLRLIQIQRGRSIQRVTPRDLGQIYDWAYYVWKPDFDKLWPSTAADQTLTETSVRRRPGKAPKYDWPLNVAREVIRRIESGEKHPTAPAMIRHCKETIRYEPDDSDMRKLLKFLRGN